MRFTYAIVVKKGYGHSSHERTALAFRMDRKSHVLVCHLNQPHITYTGKRPPHPHPHTVQVTILQAPPHHHHHTVQVTMHAFSMCAIALQKRPPPPPPHSASYNIMTTTTSARRVSALVGHRKRPPVQVTAEPGQHQHHSNHHICHRVNALDG